MMRQVKPNEWDDGKNGIYIYIYLPAFHGILLIFMVNIGKACGL